MENKKTYLELLRSPLWQKKRLKILERDDFTCQHCGCKERELQVHHRVYHKGANSYRELTHYMLFEAYINGGVNSDLDILCKNGFQLTEEEIDILKMCDKESLDKYSLLKEKYNESDE